MKALSIWQPWASLIASGHKTIETRSWPAPQAVQGQRIAIHAGKREARLEEFDIEERRILNAALGDGWLEQIPYGVIVATAVLTHCEQVDAKGNNIPRYSKRAGLLDNLENVFGDWNAGRWMWHLTDVWIPYSPVPVRGQQGMWTLTQWEEARALVRYHPD